MTDGQTDRPRYLVSNNRHVYVHSTAMQPSNNRQFVNNRDIVYGAVFMTITRVHPVDLMITQTDHQAAGNPQTKPTNLGCKSASRPLLSTSTIAVYCYC